MNTLTPLMFVVVALKPPILSAQTSYVEEAQAAGLHIVHTPAFGHPAVSMVGGGTVGDFNNDGLPDVFVFGGGGVPDALFINQGGGMWADQAASWGLVDQTFGVGAAVGDFDRDGWQDLFVTSWGDSVGGLKSNDNRLYRNNGNGTFTNVAAAAGVQAASTGVDSYGACFGDYDHDGWLDLFVCAYGPNTNGNRLFRNNRNGGFVDVTAWALPPAVSLVHGLACSFADMDDDGWPELLLIGDTGTGRYYVNNRDGTFRDETAGVQDWDEPNGMGIATGDYDSDGDLDLYVSDIYWPLTGLGGNRLFTNQGNHQFTENGAQAGVNISGWGWAPVSTDIDNDGLLEIGCTNGWAGSWASYPTRLYYNQGNGTFIDLAGFCGLMHYGFGRGMYVLDGDQDGDEDIFITGMTEASTYWRNDVANGYSWLDVEFDTYGHPHLAPHGIGTKVEAIVGNTTYRRDLNSHQSYLGQSELYVHFGLGGAQKVDVLKTTWADGFVSFQYDVLVNQRIQVVAQPPYSLSPLVRGSMAQFELAGIQPGESALFAYSLAGAGPAGPFPQVGNMHLALTPPIHIAGSAVAGSDGIARLQVMVPLQAPQVPVHTQAVVRRGVAMELSVRSNSITRTIQ